MTWFIDTSALVKLCVEELESVALDIFVDGNDLVASELVLTELVRVVRLRSGSTHSARALLETLDLVPADQQLLASAGVLQPDGLRSLDAIHLATALTLGDACEGIITYDTRMQEAARAAGLTVPAPGQD